MWERWDASVNDVRLARASPTKIFDQVGKELQVLGPSSGWLDQALAQGSAIDKSPGDLCLSVSK